MERRSKRLTPDVAPITPDIPAYLAVPPLTKGEVEALRTENRKLRAQLSYEKRKHETIINALARQLGEVQRTTATLQQTLSSVREAAIELFAKELKPRGSR